MTRDGRGGSPQSSDVCSSPLKQICLVEHTFVRVGARPFSQDLQGTTPSHRPCRTADGFFARKLYKRAPLKFQIFNWSIMRELFYSSLCTANNSVDGTFDLHVMNEEWNHPTGTLIIKLDHKEGHGLNLLVISASFTTHNNYRVVNYHSTNFRA